MNKSLNTKDKGASAKADRVPTGSPSGSVLPPSSEGTTPSPRLRKPWLVRRSLHTWIVYPEGDTVSIIARTGSKAQARLIASAPDLLDALDAILKAHDESTPPRYEYNETPRIAAARAAIAKATGK